MRNCQVPDALCLVKSPESDSEDGSHILINDQSRGHLEGGEGTLHALVSGLQV